MYLKKDIGGTSIGVCSFDRDTEDTTDDILCFPISTDRKTWNCEFIETGKVCASNCTEENPANCCTATDPCNGDGFYHSWYADYYSKSFSGCCWEHINGSTICQDQSTYFLISENLNPKCGWNGYMTLDENGKITKIYNVDGWCEDLGCSEYDGTYASISPTVYGCLYDNDIGCAKMDSGNGPYICYFNEKKCGEFCSDITPENCKAWYLKPCAPDITVDGVTKPKCVYGQTMWADGDTETDKHYDCFCDGDVDTTTNICCPTGQIVQDGICVVDL